MTETPQQPPGPSAPQQPQQPPGAGTGQQGGNGIAVAGMILGIISVATCWIWCAWFIATACGVVGLILSIVGMKKAQQLGGLNAGKAKAGIITSAIGIVVSVVVMILVMVFVGQAATTFGEQLQRAAQQYGEASQ